MLDISSYIAEAAADDMEALYSFEIMNGTEDEWNLSRCKEVLSNDEEYDALYAFDADEPWWNR